MVSKPSFDPNLFVTGISFKEYAALHDSIDRPLFNRVLRGLYAPGSTIKPEVAIAGLDSGVVTAQTRVFDPVTISCPTSTTNTATGTTVATVGSTWTPPSCAPTTLTSTTWRTSWHRPSARLLAEFGLGQKVSLDMFEESAGLMPSQAWKRATRRQPWFPGETVILGIGQGYMQVTPLQLAQATALIANKGVWNRPHLAKTINGVPPVDENPMPNVVLKDPRDWEQVNHGMQLVMHDPRGIAGPQRRCAIPYRRQERYGPGGSHQAG
jgi:penicillin-binding protein 2